MKFSTSLVKFGSVGDLALELKKALTAIAAGWNVEHNPDGTHKHNMTVGLHADTHANGGTDEVALDGSQITTGTLADARLSANVALKNASNVFTKPFATGAHAISVQAALPLVSLLETGQPADARLFRIYEAAGQLHLAATNDAETLNTGEVEITRGGDLHVTGSASIAGTIGERGRSVPMGEWTDVPFNAANFTGVGGTWTVTAATYAYILLGKTVVFSLTIPGTSTITGAPTALNVAYPAGLASPTRITGTSFHYVMAGGTTGTGLCQMHTAFPTVLYITRDAASTAFAAGTCSIYLQGHYSIP